MLSSNSALFQLAPSEACTKRSLHQAKLTPSEAYTKRSLHQAKLTPSEACSKRWKS